MNLNVSRGGAWAGSSSVFRQPLHQLILMALVWLGMAGLGPACGYDPSQDRNNSPTPIIDGDDDSETPTSVPQGCTDEDDDGWCLNPDEGQADCNDRDPEVYPGALEICDNKDNDCDGVKDIDEDGDGFASSAKCPRSGDDCDDTDPDINPDAKEVCNFVDDDCNGIEDDGVEPRNYYPDNDGDGYGREGQAQAACTKPRGYVSNDLDCNDLDPEINPDAQETCNGIDDDCDGEVDDGAKYTSWPDGDGDGYGNAAGTPRNACAVPSGYVLNDSDCDDSNPAISPSASEFCNQIDDNCNGVIDDELQTWTYYFDSDGDGFGDPEAPQEACMAPEGYSELGTDCDDTDAQVYPKAEERCNGLDDDCDEVVPDEEVLDSDGDGSPECADCDDADPSVSPLVAETCNGLDDNCNGEVDEGFDDGRQDSDGDGLEDCLDDCPRWVSADAEPGGSGLWASPHDAIQKAISAFGVDTNCSYIRVRPGTYLEAIDFKGRPLRIEATVVPPALDPTMYSEGDEPATEGLAVIDAQGQGTAVSFVNDESPSTVLRGFVIRGGNGVQGGGITMIESSPTIKNNYVIGNSSESGGGIYFEGPGQPVIIDNDIIDNQASGPGGGILLKTASQVDLSGNRIVANRAHDGAGVYFEEDVDISGRSTTLVANDIYYNTASNMGGGLFTKGYCLGEISSNTFVGNQAMYGGGIYVSSPDDSVITITDGTLEGNVADVSGGGVFVTGIGGTVFETLRIAEGTAASGAGIYVDSDAGVLMDGMTLEANGGADAQYGGGLYVSSGATVTFVGGDILSNEVAEQGGGIYAASQSSVSIEGSLIDLNKALNGGGIYAVASTLLEVKLGEDDAATVISNNEAVSRGGGLYLEDFDPSGTSGVLLSNRIHDNQASNGAGLALDNSSILMTGNQIRENTALGGEGGGVLCDGALRMKIPVSNVVQGNEPQEIEGCE